MDQTADSADFTALLDRIAPRLRPAPGDDAIIATTAGTTGAAAARRVPVATLEARSRALAAALGLGPQDRLHVALPETDLLGAVPLLAAALSGTPVVEAAQATVLVTTPPALWPLLRRLGARRAALGLARRLPALKPRLFAAERGPLARILVTAGPLPAADRALLEAVGIRVDALYGLTEAGGPVAHDPDGFGYRPLGNAALDVPAPAADGFGGLTVDSIASGDRACRLGDGRFAIAGRLATALPHPDGTIVQAEALEQVYGRHPLIADLAVTLHDGAPVALVRPDLDAIRMSATARIDDAMRVALAEQATGRPRGEQLAGHVLIRKPLARNRRGEPVRPDLADRYAALLSGEADAASELSPEDAALLADPTAATLWAWLRNRFPGQALSLDHSLQLDLAIDSLEWVTFALELEQVAGVPLDEEVLARATTLRDLLAEAVERQGRPVPERHAAGEAVDLDAAQREWIAPLRWYHRLTGILVFGLLTPLIRWPFRLRVEGLENLPRSGGVLIVANHLSDLDPPIVGASLPYAVARRAYWSGEATRLFGSPLLRFLARSFRIFPTQERVASTSLAYAKAVLDRGDVLTWFPESWRSPDGRLQKFMPGVGRIIAESDVMIVPARIVGTYEAMPRGAHVPSLHPVTIRFAPPIRSADILARAGAGASHAEIAATLRESLVALPGEPPPDADGAPVRRRSTTAAGSPLLHVLWALQAIPMWLLYFLIRLVPLDAASGFGGRLARTIGPRLKLSERARHNLRRCWPDMAKDDVEATVAGMWDNLGRLAGEIIHLDALRDDGADPRITLVGGEHIEAAKHSGRPAIFFTGHLANWELTARVAALHHLPVTLVYRQANNPWAEKLIQRCRGAGATDLVPKGAEAAQRIVEAMRTGGRIGLVADQKTNNGIAAPFFGRPAMTTPVLAMCAQGYDCPLYPVQVERLGGARFRVTVHPPLDVARTGDERIDRLAITTAVNSAIESWVRLRPEQWMWLHRRWPD